MGHYFGLQHTFPFYLQNDPSEPGFIGRDGDGLDDPLCTPDDPGISDGVNDIVKFLGLLPGHEYCDPVEWNDADSNSPKPTYCSAECFQNTGNGPGPLVLPNAPLTENAMSVYDGTGKSCMGPYIKQGVRHPAFCDGQVDRIRQTWQAYHSELHDVCES